MGKLEIGVRYDWFDWAFLDRFYQRSSSGLPCVAGRKKLLASSATPKECPNLEGGRGRTPGFTGRIPDPQRNTVQTWFAWAPLAEYPRPPRPHPPGAAQDISLRVDCVLLHCAKNLIAFSSRSSATIAGQSLPCPAIKIRCSLAYRPIGPEQDLLARFLC